MFKVIFRESHNIVNYENEEIINNYNYLISKLLFGFGEAMPTLPPLVAHY